MTTRREVPLTGDTLAWVHSELAEIKSRLAIVQQAAEQSRGLATDAADTAHQARTKVDQYDAYGTSILHLQDDVRVAREQLVRAQDDIHSLRASREEIERRAVGDAERSRQDKNEIGRHFSEIERLIGSWQELLASAEEHNRRNLETLAQISMRVEVLERDNTDLDTLQSRSQTSLSRIEQEIQRLSATVATLQREDDIHRERSNSTMETLRRIETETELIRAETNKFNRIEDRLELVQAERTRHNERLNEITTELASVDSRLNEQGEHLALVDARIAGYQDELRALNERLQRGRETIGGYLHSLNELQADIRKRQISAIEKEIRDIRGRGLNFTEE
jgi:chromosome segregation ATPase